MKPLSIVLLLFSFVGLAHSQPTETFTLLNQNSNVQFQVDSLVLPIKGRIEKFSGRLIKTGAAPNQFQVILDCDLASVKFTGEETKGLPISEILTSVKNSSVHFEGRTSGRRPDGAAKVTGKLSWRGKSYQVSFPVKIKGDALQVVLDGNIQSNGDELVAELPVLAVFQVQNALAQGKLVFSKIPIKMNSTLES